jgi:hypothetical protein
MSTPCLHCKEHTPIRNQTYAKHLLLYHPLAIVKDNPVFVNELKRSIKNKRAYVCYAFKLNEDNDEEELKRRYCCFGCGISTTETYIKKHIKTHLGCAEKHFKECEKLLSKENAKDKTPITREKGPGVENAVKEYEEKVKLLEKQLETLDNVFMYTKSTFEQIMNNKFGHIKRYRYDQMFDAIRGYFEAALKDKEEPDDGDYEDAASVGMDWQFYEDEE